MMPEEPGSHAVEPAEPPQRPQWRWYHKMSAVLLITFCLEIGIFLAAFPWTDYWDHNYFASLMRWRPYWDNLYVRGAITGLGFVNLYISLSELFRLRRFSKH
ncbi:MAG TPA: hypothetical protein VN736_16475 [Candidatus Limnocylindrales bacterium]|nr:hypothetical protein [Candidatus Limnocylindrales bacterium]